MPNVSRLKFLRDLLLTVKEEAFSLRSWRSWCKTTACAVGHGALNPVLNAQGLHLKGAEVFVSLSRPVDNLLMSWYAVQVFFGITKDDADHLFDATEYPNEYGTSLQEVIDRLSSYISKVDGEQIIEGEYVTLFQIPNGDLSIRLNHEYFCELDRVHLKSHLESLGHVLLDIGANSSYELTTGDWLGALTEAPVFAEIEWDEEGVEPKIVGSSWYFPQYQTEDPFDTLVQDGEVVFTTTPEYEKQLKQERGGILCSPIPID